VQEYSSRVGPEKMREFCNVLDAIRYRSTRVHTVPAWFAEGRSPIVGLVIGPSGFTSGAQDLAGDHGIVVASSIDIAEMIARSRKLEPTASVPVRLGTFEAAARVTVSSTLCEHVQSEAVAAKAHFRRRRRRLGRRSGCCLPTSRLVSKELISLDETH
jgi:hypothetical protein